MTTTTTIPLNSLVPSKKNVRRGDRTAGIATLAASIAAHGLRQNLNVEPGRKANQFEVVAGGRRLRALKLLAKQGKLAKDAPIACLVLDENDDAAEISLAENVQRISMHPLDEFEAFNALVTDKHLSIEDVAARFGVTPMVVTRRLKLANVSPSLRSLYRKEAIDLETMMAFAISDDRAAQDEAWATLPEWQRKPSHIRAYLTREAVAPTDKLVRFVGLDAYVEAGGGVLRDLFSTDEPGYLTDRPLLLRLASDKLAAAIEGVQAEGWKWVISELEPDYATRFEWVDALANEEEDDDTERFAPEDVARAGARLRIHHDGSLLIERGLIHPDDTVQGEVESGAEAGATQTGKAKAAPGGFPAAVTEELSAHRTAALRIELARNPAVALAASVHALTVSLLYAFGQRSASCLKLTGQSEGLDRHAKALDDGTAHQAMQEEAERWGERLPGDVAELWDWCLTQPQDVLLELLAFTTALTIDAVEGKFAEPGKLAHANQLAEALSLDMTHHWSPSAEHFYARLSKTMLIDIVTEAKAPMNGPIAPMKKDEAVRCVAKAMLGTGWLPRPLRAPMAIPAVAEAA